MQIIVNGMGEYTPYFPDSGGMIRTPSGPVSVSLTEAHEDSELLGLTLCGGRLVVTEKRGVLLTYKLANESGEFASVRFDYTACEGVQQYVRTKDAYVTESSGKAEIVAEFAPGERRTIAIEQGTLFTSSRDLGLESVPVMRWLGSSFVDYLTKKRIPALDPLKNVVLQNRRGSSAISPQEPVLQQMASGEELLPEPREQPGAVASGTWGKVKQQAEDQPVIDPDKFYAQLSSMSVQWTAAFSRAQGVYLIGE